jgi:dipeptidyl aminopeptidase/acylaminoacyl peptidase
MKKLILLACALALPSLAFAQNADAPTRYMDAPQPIARILDTPPPPAPSVSPTRTQIALLGRANLPPIAELAEPELRLAGYRINPRNNGPANSRIGWLNALSFQDVASRAVRPVALPAGFRFMAPSWSPDGRRIAFLRGVETGLELWVAEVASGQARRLTGPRVNAAFDPGLEWLPDSSALLVRLVPEGRGAAPAAAQVPSGPIIQENAGRTAPVRTYQDLLRNAGDEALFDHYFTAQLALVSIGGGPIRNLGAPGLIAAASLSPSGRYISQTRLKRPFSYNVPAELFPAELVVTDLAGRVVHRVADLPLRDDVPIQFDSVAPGPREVHWRADRPETLVWVEAQDGGDIRRQAAIRDRILTLDAPFTGPPQTLIDLADRFAVVLWGRDDFALVVTRRFNDRNETRIAVDPSRPGQPGRTLVSRNYQNRYDNPGFPMLRPKPDGAFVIHFTADGSALFMSGPGATREGEFPFVSRMDLATGRSERIWQAAMPYYESVVALLDDNGAHMLTRRESKTEPPNLFLRDSAGGEPVRLTDFPDPAPQFAGVQRELITYRRPDGVQLSGTLYLPPGYDRARDGPLPLLMWAYPAEFTDAAVAGQVVDTVNRFVRPGGISHLFLLTQGYAILDNPAMPIVGANGAEPNDTYVQQLVADAQAAADEVVRLGVASRDRLAIGGHSYGAFMTANLLAHSDIFRTGIARSGAYNRTLTPFGFQSEQRSYWEAVETYTEMSPFTHVRRINEPILLIHGENDDNPGTFPIQTERFYAALKGNGATVRYVVLPLEAHGYRARESAGHTLWEMNRWLDLHLRAPPTAPAAAAR